MTTLQKDVRSFYEQATAYVMAQGDWTQANNAGAWTEYVRLSRTRELLNWRLATAPAMAPTRSGSNVSFLTIAFTFVIVIAPIVYFLVLGRDGNQSLVFNYNIDVVEGVVGSALTFIAAVVGFTYVLSARSGPAAPNGGQIPPIPRPPGEPPRDLPPDVTSWIETSRDVPMIKPEWRSE